MNITSFLVLIIIGGILTNFTFDKLIEGMENNDSIDELIKKVETHNEKNKNSVEIVNLKVNELLKKFNNLKGRLEYHKQSKEISNATNCKKHISVPCTSTSTQMINTFPKKGCPNKNTDIEWPKQVILNNKGKRQTKPLISKVDSIQVESWKKSYFKDLQNTRNIEKDFITAYNNVTSIDNIGNEINVHLQNNNF